MACNQLSLYVNKTKFMVFRTVRKNVNYPTLLINGINIESVEDFSIPSRMQVTKNLKWNKFQNDSIVYSNYALMGSPGHSHKNNLP